MKIAYNPKTAAVITTATAANDDILFDLNAKKVWAKGLRMGADWADISSKPSSLKNPYALTISLNGTSQGPYDGSAAKNINITPSSIGAATSGHNHDDRYYTKAESNAKYITDIATSVNKLTFTRNESNINKDITVNVVYSLGSLTNIADKDATTKASSGLVIYNSYSLTIGTNSYSSVLSINTGGTIQIAGNWGDDLARNLYWRSLSDRPVASYPWKSWRTILDSENYSSTLDSRYYTESEIDSLLDAKLNRQNLSYGTWNPRSYNLAADYHYNGGDLSISESGGKIHVSVDGYFWLNEGLYRVLDTSDVAELKNNLTVHLYLSNTDTTWYPLIWGGGGHTNTSDSTGAVYKSYDKLYWLTSSLTLYATHLKTTDLNTLTALFHPDHDSTLKIYSGKITDGKSDGNICLLTSIDGTDGLSHIYPTQYGARCNLVLQPSGGQVYIGTNPDGGNTDYKLYVNGGVYASSRLDVRGDAKITGSIRDLAIGGGIYWNPHVESAGDNSDAASITLVRAGVAGGTTLVLSLMNDANDTILFKTSDAARLYHNNNFILTSKDTKVTSGKGYIDNTEITQVNNSINADMIDNVHLESILTFKNSIGNQTQNNHDFHSELKLGVYEIDWGGYIANHPSDWEDGSNHYGLMLHFGNANNNHSYILLDKATNNMYFKNISSKTSYGLWYKVAHSGNSSISGSTITINGNSLKLNIANWDTAYNLRHSHANKSVLDGITSGLVTNWNTAYNFVSTITGEDADNVINKWDEIVNFLAGITEDNKLNTLLNSKLSVYELANNTNVGAIKNNGIYYSTTDASSGTLTNSPFNTGFALINMTSYDGGDDLRRSRLAFNAYGEIKVSNDGDLANTAETWYNVLTSKNSGIDGSTIKLNGTSITVYSSSTADGRYVKKSGDTMTGALNFANNIWNQVGDDVAIGDHNIAGCLGIKGLNAGPGLAFYNSSNTLLSKLVGTANLFLRVSGDNTYNILDNSTTHINNNTITINGTSLTVSKSDHNHDNKYLRLDGSNTMTGQIKSSYSASTWINGCTNAILKATSNGYNSLICAPIKSGNICISAWTNEDNLNFGYAKNGKTENNFDTRMYWDAPNNNLHAAAFTGHLYGTADNATNSDKLNGYHASGLLTALSNSNRGISLTVGGTTKSLSNISVGDADTVDGEHASAFTRIVGRHSIATDGTKPYRYIHLFRIANSGGYSTVDCEIDLRTRYHSAKLEIRIATNQYPYSSDGSSISIIKKVINGRSCNFWVLETVQSSGYNYYDIYYESGSWNTGVYDIISRGNNGVLVFEHKGTKLDALPDNVSVVNNLWVIWKDIAEKPSSFTPAAHNHDGRYLRLNGLDTMQGNLKLFSYGDSYIGKGSGDKSGEDFTEANIVIRSWWGISFKSYDDKVRTYIDTRTGNIGTKGKFIGNLTGNATSATKVIVNQHTANDTNYPLVWSNLSNTNNATENQLYKSWLDLYYNPKNKRLFVRGSVSTANINATGTVTSAGFKHSGVTENADLYVLTAGGGYTFLNLTSNELAHEFDVNITVTSEWLDIEDFYGGNLSFLTLPGTYIVLVYYTTNSANSMYEGYFSGIMSWYTGTTNSNNADEIVLHRVGHAYANTIYLRTRESLRDDPHPYTKLQISANSDLKQHTYKFKFKRIC